MQNTKLLLSFCVLIIFFGLGFLYTNFDPSEQVKSVQTENPQAGVLIIKVVDGDTVEIEGGARVRLLGVDTPETVDPRRPVGCFGKEASNKAKELLSGRRVSLEKDISDTDKYGRLLRYIYLPLENGQTLFVNDYLIREGFAKVLTIPPDVGFAEQFLEAQRQARESSRGLWGAC